MGIRYLKIRESKLEDISRLIALNFDFRKEHPSFRIIDAFLSSSRRVLGEMRNSQIPYDEMREKFCIPLCGEEEIAFYESTLFSKRKLNRAPALRFLLPHYMNNLFALEFRRDGFDGPWIPNPGFRTKSNNVIPVKFN